MLAVIAHKGSFARAAQAMNMTPSAVSKRIQELEARVHTRLATRTPEGVRLTPAGKAMVECAHALLERISSMSREIAESMNGQSGEVHISANSAAILLGLNTSLLKFQKQYPDTLIHLSEKISADVVADVQAGTADIGVCAETAIPDHLSVAPYHESELVVAMAKSHPLARRTSLTYKEVIAFPNVGRPPGSALWDISPVPHPEGPCLGVRAEVHSFDAMLEIVRGGQYISILPRVTIDRRSAPDIVVIPLAENWASFKLVVCHDAALMNTPVVLRAFNYLAQQPFAVMPPPDNQ